MMKGKLAGVKGLTVKCHLAVRNPDALPIDIHFTGRRATGGFLRTGAWKERPVKQGQLRLTGWIGNNGREEAGILVVYAAEAKVASPRRLQWKISSDTARAIRGPWDDHAV